jgi:FG-GAP repeat
MKRDSLVCATYSPSAFGSVYDGASGAAEFGWSVAVNCDGSQVLVGSANDPSAVYMFDQYGEIVRTFHNPRGSHAEHDGVKSQFGFAVQMNVNGQRILIGDPAFQAVYMYDDRGHLMHTFEVPNTETDTMFGADLAISDDVSVVAIGAQLDGKMESGAGAVYLFYDDLIQHSEYHDNHWVMAEPIVNTRDPVSNGGFGVSVALSPDGSRLLVGAWNERESQGAAHLYQISSPSVNETINEENGMPATRAVEYLCTFKSPNPAIAKWFGWAVDLTGRYAIVGARGEEQNHKKNAGAVYVFSLQQEDEGIALTVIDTIHQPMPVESEQFGAAVSAAGDRLLVASYNDGTAYWYESTTTYVAAAQTNKTYFALREKIPVPTLVATSASFSGTAVALSRNGRAGVVGVPRALGRTGYMTAGSAFGVCLPKPEVSTSFNYTCPDLDLPSVSWKDVKAFWFSWDSDSGKILALMGTLILCGFILFYRSKHQQQQRRHVFERLSTEAGHEYELELHVIQEESEVL